MTPETIETTDAAARTVNVELLRKVLEHITAHPDEHDQEVWARRTACGTAMCLAGHAVVMTGHRIDWSLLDIGGLATFTTTGEIIEAVAERELGLDLGQSVELFSAANTLARLWMLAAELTDGEITPPPELAR